MTGATSLHRARNLLARPGAWIDQQAERGANLAPYAVRLSPDRRGRVVMHLDETQLAELIAAPGLCPRSGGGWTARTPSAEPADRAGRPGVALGQRSVIMPDGQVVQLRANLGQCPLVWLAQRSDSRGQAYLTSTERAAGERLRLDAEMALRGRSVTMSWDGLPRASSGSAARSEPGVASLSASRRVALALTSISLAARPVVQRICLAHSGLQAAEADLGLRRRQGRFLLKRGLAELAHHYRVG